MIKTEKNAGRAEERNAKGRLERQGKRTKEKVRETREKANKRTGNSIEEKESTQKEIQTKRSRKNKSVA